MEKRKSGSMLMFYIFSAILVICQVLIFLFQPILPPGLALPLLLKCLPLLALIMLWIKGHLFQGKRGFSVLKALIWILIVTISLGALLETEFSLFALADREKSEAPVTIGLTDNSKAITLVYHPGGTRFQKTVNRLVAEKLAQSGFLVTLYTAHAGLKLHPQPGMIIGLASPVYFGNIRPPLTDFIQNTNLTGVKCFVILTGSVDTADEVENLKKIIESKGGVFLDGRKFISNAPLQTAEIEAFVNEIYKKLSL